LLQTEPVASTQLSSNLASVVRQLGRFFIPLCIAYTLARRITALLARRGSHSRRLSAATATTAAAAAATTSSTDG